MSASNFQQQRLSLSSSDAVCFGAISGSFGLGGYCHIKLNVPGSVSIPKQIFLGQDPRFAFVASTQERKANNVFKLSCFTDIDQVLDFIGVTTWVDTQDIKDKQSLLLWLNSEVQTKDGEPLGVCKQIFEQDVRVFIRVYSKDKLMLLEIPIQDDHLKLIHNNDKRYLELNHYELYKNLWIKL